MVKTLMTAYQLIALCLWGKGAVCTKVGSFIVIRLGTTVILISRGD
jgi:hypothetical protein